MIYVLSTLIENWIKLLTPFTPHTSEELWSKYGGSGFVSEAKWPEYDESTINENIIASEQLTQNLVKDITEIMKMVKEDVGKIHIYLAPDWKWDLYRIADEVGKPDIGQIMGKAIKDNIHSDKKDIAQNAKKISKEITKTKYIGKIDEASILEDSKAYIEEECGSEVIIHIDDSYDPQNKARNAMPYKPAIFLE